MNFDFSIAMATREIEISHNDPVLDMDRLALIVESCGLDGASSLVHIFLQDYRDIMKLLDEALKGQELDRIKFLCHRMKSGAANIGAIRFAQKCTELERISPHDPLETQQKLFDQVFLEYERACAELVRRFNNRRIEHQV